jgi:pimeloyl-ACP methyl ester carboxylesterase
MTKPTKTKERIRAQGRKRRWGRRRTLALAASLAVAGLLLGNAALVSRQSAGADSAGRESGGSMLSLDGGNIHVREDGPRDAPALVLIHGFTASTRSWDALVPLLAGSHRVIRIDLLGHGRSAKPAGGGYTIPDQGRRVGAALDRLGVRSATLVGHSTGGSVATALAEQRPGLVTALALIDTGPRLDAFVSEGAVGNLLFTPVLGQLLWRLRTDGLIREAASTAFSRPGFEAPQAVVDDVRGMTYHAFTATSRAVEDYLTERPVPERLKPLGKPLLVIFGAEDRRWRPASADDYRVVPGARVETLSGLGHSPNMEDPPRTAALLLAFAAEHRG